MLVCGVAYPLLVTGISQVVLPYQANGSQAQLGGRVVGSYYIDNGFTLPVFFHGRNESNPQTASASGVDPDIPLADALSQVPRVSNATGIPASSLDALVKSHEQWTLFLAGDPYVNVLELNLALIGAYPSVYSAYS
ncbi:MAG: potassium-transporting ATPase subunit C [Nitrososphaerota archaeon]|nr:potassium-transporting ATPase subunit C [Nitrososphaerota archaeon]MDG7023515.1 potassium-transporting ATPase subunit C [Nitrososphaerota archaeon]